MHLRLGQDMRLGIGREAGWAMVPTAFKPLTVLQLGLGQIPARRRRQDLGRGQIATKSQLIHSHIGGDISWQLAFGNGDDLLASMLASNRRTDDVSGLIDALPRGVKLSWIVLNDIPNRIPLPSFSLLRRLASGDDWYHFHGLKVSRLRLTIGNGGEAVLSAAMIGKMSAPANKATTRYGNAMPFAPVSRPFNLNLAPSVLSIQTLDGASRVLRSTSDFALSHLALNVTRGGMTPLFGLSAMAPIGITDGLLAIDGALHLLHTPSLAALLREDARLKLQLTMYDGSGHAVVILLPESIVTNSDIETSSPALPPMLNIQFESRNASQKTPSIPLIAIGMAELDAG